MFRYLQKMLAEAEKSGDPDNLERVRELTGRLSQIPDTTSGVGFALSTASLQPNGQSNVGMSALGSGLQGFGAGLNAGILPAIGLGLVSAAGGLQSAAQTNADYFDDKTLADKFELSSKTVSPSILGPGGFMGTGDEKVPVQMEKKETYVTDDLSIYDSKAKAKHEDMDPLKITDVVKPGSFAFSTRKFFTPGNHADELLGYGLAHYNEEGDYELEEVVMGEVFGNSKKEITFAQAADKIRKHFKTVDDGENRESDLLTKITNQENKQARMPYLNRLIQLHQNPGATLQQGIVPTQYAMGGTMGNPKKPLSPELMIRHYAEGGVVGKETDPPKKKGDKIYVLGYEPKIGDSIDVTAWRESVNTDMKRLETFKKVFDGKLDPFNIEDPEDVSFFEEMVGQTLTNRYLGLGVDRDQLKGIDSRVLFSKFKDNPDFRRKLDEKYESRKGFMQDELESINIFVKNTDEEGHDITFRKEFDRAGKDVFSDMYDDVEYIPIRERGKVKGALSKIPKNANVAFMDHSGDYLFGERTSEFINMLAEKQLKTCIGGSCFGQSLFEDSNFKEISPNTDLYLTPKDEQWTGFDKSKKGMDRLNVQKYKWGGKVKKHAEGDFMVDDQGGGRSMVLPDGRKVTYDENGNLVYVDSGTDSMMSMFDTLDTTLTDYANENEMDKLTAQSQYSSLFRRANTRNAVAGVGDLFTIGTQGTQVSPRLRSTIFADDVFEEIPGSEIDATVSGNFARVNSIASQVAGSNPALAERLLPGMLDSALTASNRTAQTMNAENRANRRAKYRFLNDTYNFNRGERIRAEEATRDAINRKKAGLGTAFNRFLTNRNQLDVNEVGIDRSIQNQYNKNRMGILGNRMSLAGTRTKYDLSRALMDERLQSLTDFLNRNRRQEPVLDQSYVDDVMSQDIVDIPLGYAS